MNKESQEAVQKSNYTDKVMSEKPEVSNTQVIFDERFSLFMNQFGETCENENTIISFAAVVDRKLPSNPIIFMRGNEYDVAVLLTRILRQLKTKINDSIQI